MCVQIAKTASRAVERTEPDVHLIKTGGTRDKVGFGRTDVALRPDSEHAGHGCGRNPCISDLAITALAVIWLQKHPKHPEEIGRPVCEGAVWQCYRP
jgi:hypothetical protein